eukprot:scaffold12243_cov116-Isochrysis_galbana.AAC.9
MKSRAPAQHQRRHLTASAPLQRNGQTSTVGQRNLANRTRRQGKVYSAERASRCGSLKSASRESVQQPAPAARGLPLQLNVLGVAGAQVEDVIAEHVEGGTVERFCEDVGDHVARGNEEWFDDVSCVQVFDEHHGPFEVARARGAA